METLSSTKKVFYKPVIAHFALLYHHEEPSVSMLSQLAKLPPLTFYVKP